METSFSYLSATKAEIAEQVKSKSFLENALSFSQWHPSAFHGQKTLVNEEQGIYGEAMANCVPLVIPYWDDFHVS